ncbi:1-acyl-sn-glycerol-3-phosphate acyltransferase [Falsirhodobacter sp. 20TX0035]|uniref:1-acyl-sn-glycerol-3-phosphate acyltransferase n=1 Tax=Falsirhodobacter sp. 20TX0035 TaxID=3022019 RepID=UPI002331371E|nr:1-acyl-sn-glycerol-3-phosphate acyltransferase [Falsirhodobacter sp. 20TX0035]MDB6452358.1 1-acyl-sn-glycerol-3-phosphate acyltransferase [Falsirhodobacter sp. 20TX0035]
MTATIELPVWLLVLVLAFALVAALDRILVPSARWYLRRRMERVVARLNLRLERPIEPFKLMRRQDMILRLAHDPDVSAAVARHARSTNTREDVVFERARVYAREIVPAFSATVYFGFATRFARKFSRAFYDVKIAASAPKGELVNRDATVVFVMNHRSNMDYVLVTWLVAQRSALSYAVGEWARIWPLSSLIRAMGAYFIRRNARSPLYRRVLARYVQMSTEAGVTQAFFPEGGLSLDGRIGAPKVGLFSYLMAAEGRDLLFVPVGIAYDRVLEDRILTEADRVGERRFRAGPVQFVGFLLRNLWRLVRGRFPGFGAAGVAFGTPVSLQAWKASHAGDPGPDALARDLMDEIGRNVPVLPVPLVAAALSRGSVSRRGLPAAVAQLRAELARVGAVTLLPEDPVAEGLRALEKRDIVIEQGGRLIPAAGKARLLAFYAASVLQRLDRGTEGRPDGTEVGA